MADDSIEPVISSNGEDVSEPDFDDAFLEVAQDLFYFQFCYNLFPNDYEFDQDDLVQLWVSQRLTRCLPPNFILPPQFENMMEWEVEDIANFVFDVFVSYRVFQMSGRNHSTGRPRYKLNISIVSFLQEQRHDTYFRAADDKSYISKNSLHCSLSDSINFKELYVAERLRTILILHKPTSFFNQVPRDLFLKLPLLRAIDFSHTNITELPSSIGNLKDLVYLNLSGTPITALPTSLCCLYQMQTLKLRGCIKLLSLPEDMRKLRYLHHLDVDVACLLLWMPPGLGDLTSLRTLPAFVVGKEKGCGISELEHMAMLSGNLAILRLENVSSSDEAKEATLDRKMKINKLELQWTELQDGFMLLENLQPHEDIRELEIVGYGGVKFPNWIGDPIFSSLTILNIHSCAKCNFLPPLGKLPSLRCLSISAMHSVRRIAGEFCDRKIIAEPLENVLFKKGTRRSISGNTFTAFPQLRKLTLHKMQILEKWSGVEEGDFPSMQELTISGCPKLTALPAVSVIKSLRQLEISMCPLIESFPKEGLPTSLQCLVVIDCPLLKKQLHKKNGREFGMLPHIHCAWIDYEQISKGPEQMLQEKIPNELSVNVRESQTKAVDVSSCTSDVSVEDKPDSDVETESDPCTEGIGSEDFTKLDYDEEMKSALCTPGIFEEDVPELDADDETEFISWKMFENMMCFRFLYLFPKNYDFLKDDLIHLWVAQRFIPRPPPDFFPPPPFENVMEWDAEDLANLIFDIFQYYRIFQMSGLDHSTGRPRYKVDNAVVNFLQEKHYDAYFQFENDKSHVSETTLYASLGNDTSGPITLKELYVAESLGTLLILHDTGSCFNEVPRGLFLKLPLLRVLDFSHTNISELPSSIGNLKDLEYLNLSGTPITILPNSLCCLYQMQILKLRGCSKLLGLPEDIRKLTNLRHLDADMACLLAWMPRGLGGLTSLRALPAFVVGKESGCHITELKHMAVLSGSLGILRLENVSNSDEAKEAALDQKKYIDKLELQWTEFVDGLMLLENLRPHENLKELEIVGYGGMKFPTWIGDPIFSFLIVLNIHDCIRCKVLPPLGKLPKLRCLSISGMHSIKAITGHFCGREMVAGPLERLFLKNMTRKSRSGDKFTAFPQLRILTLRRMQMLKKWTGMGEADFPNLEELSISGCSKLTALPDLSNLKSLQQLEISMCPLVEFSLKERLATSLQSVVITNCPLLKKQCRKFGILAHIRSAWIDYQQVSNLNPLSRRQEKVKIELLVDDPQSREEALNVALCTSGIVSAEVKDMEQNFIVVEGKEFDPVDLTMKIRMQFGCTKLVSVSYIDEEKAAMQTSLEASTTKLVVQTDLEIQMDIGE